jgi:hypothetical protein
MLGLNKIPPTPFTRGALEMGLLTGERLSSPFSKGGPRGILLRGLLPEDHRSILTVQAKLNYTTGIAGVF